jgi:uncharacterized protein (DUF1778 family)
MATKTATRDARIERIRLSERDSARILKLLENPPKPTKALLAAARRRATPYLYPLLCRITLKA